MKFRPKFFWKWSFFDQNQQPLKGVEPSERILRALFLSQCQYKFYSFLDLRNASHRFRLFSRDFRLFRFFFPGSACFSSLASPQSLPSRAKYHGKFESFGKEFRWTKFIAVERVSSFALSFFLLFWNPNLLTYQTQESVSNRCPPNDNGGLTVDKNILQCLWAGQYPRADKTQQ